MITLRDNYDISDRRGIDEAYALPDRVFIYNHTMYVAGTSQPRDVVDDLILPFNEVRMTHRYRVAEYLLNSHPGVTRITGHSLGAAVAEELARHYNLEHTLYANPGYGSHTERDHHRQAWDPISGLEAGAVTRPPDELNPHGYQYARRGRTGPRQQQPY